MSEIKNESVNFKYWDEMTPEEQEQLELDMWTEKKPDEGGPECVIKFLPLDASAFRTTIQTLNAIGDAMSKDAEKHGIRNEWECMDVQYLLGLLKLRARSDAGEI